MTILGIDPGLATIGYGLIKIQQNNYHHLTHGVIQTPSNLNNSERLLLIHLQLKKLIQKLKPKKCAVEQLFFHKNVKTAIQVSQARGVILLTIAQTKIPIFEFTPLQIKQALTTYGRASKLQMQKMVKAVLKLDKIPQPDDAADALATAVCCGQTRSLI